MWNPFKKKDEVKPTAVSITPISNEVTTRATKALQANGSSIAQTSKDTSYNLYMTTSDLVYACVTYIADNLSQVRFDIGTVDRTTGTVTVHKDKALVELFNTYPNEYQTWTQLWAQETQSTLLSGNSYTTFEKNKGKYEMWNLLPPQDIQAELNPKTGMIKNYMLGKNIKYKKEDILHNKLPSITSFHTGSPILEPLLDQLKLEAYATKDLTQFYENSSIGSFVLSSDQPLTLKQTEDIIVKLQREYSMDSGNRHKMFVLPNNLTPVPLRVSPKDSMILDSLNIAEDRVLQVFKLHKSILGGASDNIHYTHDMEALNETIFNNAVRPHVNRLKDTLQAFLQRRFQDPDLVVTVDYSNIPEIHRAVLKHYETARTLNVSGIMSLNEARDVLSLPPIMEDYANKHFLPQYLIGSNFVTIEELNETTVKELRQVNNPTPGDTATGSDDPLGGEPNEDNKNESES